MVIDRSQDTRTIIFSMNSSKAKSELPGCVSVQVYIGLRRVILKQRQRQKSANAEPCRFFALKRKVRFLCIDLGAGDQLKSGLKSTLDWWSQTWASVSGEKSRTVRLNLRFAENNLSRRSLFWYFSYEKWLCPTMQRKAAFCEAKRGTCVAARLNGGAQVFGWPDTWSPLNCPSIL
jgi:hypothetical protein